MLHAVIMAGGRGERFWPYGRRKAPKQFLSLLGGRSLLQRTVERILPLFSWERILVVTTDDYTADVARQLPQLPAANIVAEPFGRNTAPCLALALAELRHRRHLPADDVMVVLPADHWISDEEAFRDLLKGAASVAARTNSLVTLGITPTGPETGYGYIQAGEIVGEERGAPVHRVRRFVEKPDREQALRMLDEGGYYWNSGMFVWRLDVLEDAFARYLPELAAELTRLAGSDTRDAYNVLPAVSIDVGVMEKAEDVVVLPASVGWSDVGSWAALSELSGVDSQGNVTLGNHVALDTQQCTIFNSHSDHVVATIGLQGLVIVHTPDATLVCAKDRVQQVREVVRRLDETGQDRFL